MEFPPKPRTPYVLDKPQDRRIFKKLKKLSQKKSAKTKKELVNLLYSQLETDWRTPLEKFVDKLLK